MNHTSRGPVESVMKIKTVSLIIVTVTLLALQGCTTLSAPTGHTVAHASLPRPLASLKRWRIFPW
jgi:hypothetical protein